MAVVAAASVAGMMFAAAPATATVAAYPTSVFLVSPGTSYYTGSITWYNRSVHVTGTFKAYGCRRVYARAFPSSANVDFVSSSTWCNRTGQATLPLDTSNVVGGPYKIWIYMTDGNQGYLAGQTCYPGVTKCVDGRK